MTKPADYKRYNEQMDTILRMLEKETPGHAFNVLASAWFNLCNYRIELGMNRNMVIARSDYIYDELIHIPLAGNKDSYRKVTEDD